MIYSHKIAKEEPRFSIQGTGRLKVTLQAMKMGHGLVVMIYNNNAHIGAVALGDYDEKSKRVSTSIITRLGHKDDAVAAKAAYLISKATLHPACVIAGIHVDNITKVEINQILSNADKLVERLVLMHLGVPPCYNR